ncbi:CIC11C00000002409 [Sungouiella intermedia]|uniref:DNA damage-inducible protein 1 n=1 Tax=Sungouiella intermedia TaxID=45354 RepID=A0A1L0BW12_9ASCO|nr:CIC11C00000002409 [[Candida] intermedia]
MTKIIISYEPRDDPIGIEISDEMSLQDLNAYIESETGVPKEEQVLYHNYKRLEGWNRTIAQLGITEGDIIVLSEHKTNSISESNITSDDRIEMLRQQIHGDSQLRSQIRELDPDLFSKLSDPEVFRDIMIARLRGRDANFNVQNEEMRKLHQNPEDPENQAKIFEMIRQQQIDENLQLAYDISPESFVQVNMLYIKLRINGHETFALVDSGAQQTIIHPKLAEEFGILRFLDKRYAAMSIGIGSARTEGRIHSVPVSLGDSNLEVPCSFTVIETHVGILFGLDMLRRHKCLIDLGQDALLIGEHKVGFLNESEIAMNIKPLETSVTKDLNISSKGTSLADSTTRRQEVDSTVGSGGFAEGDLTQLISLGFTKQEAIAALKASHGNVELAASLLFQ